MISREEARDIAEAETIAKGLGGRVADIFALGEIPSARPNVYGVNLENCWVAYIEQNRSLGLYSNTIVAVDRKTGRVTYCIAVVPTTKVEVRSNYLFKPTPLRGFAFAFALR
jgi:hypothetical protein